MSSNRDGVILKADRIGRQLGLSRGTIAKLFDAPDFPAVKIAYGDDRTILGVRRADLFRELMGRGFAAEDLRYALQPPPKVALSYGVPDRVVGPIRRYWGVRPVGSAFELGWEVHDRAAWLVLVGTGEGRVGAERLLRSLPADRPLVILYDDGSNADLEPLADAYVSVENSAAVAKAIRRLKDRVRSSRLSAKNRKTRR